ncbi:DUF6249 domain-containing protein [Crocinitomix algicola]|uniref:DUF6249 domain-containing protein n=1 Tax=Crocinitomix algicola TaxID=1740263 RepID=UPI000829C72F|nr:DUF6249 domain-containing protein [Crocinitomix algicola]
MVHLTHILIPLGGAAMIFGIVYVVTTANHRENMAMIEMGMNPKEETKKHNNLRNALLFLLVPIGILVGNLVHEYFGMDSSPAAVLFAFLFGGIALVATYFIEWALDLKDDNSL